MKKYNIPFSPPDISDGENQVGLQLDRRQKN